jgi:PleD family two-component response regulator
MPRTGLSAEQLVQAADAALYQAKHQGRARYACAEPLTNIPRTSTNP